ncbi:hypothetical protein EVAR_73380_1, partial [Eumeta japonica]
VPLEASSLPQTSAFVVCGIELDNQKENISEYEQNMTPPNLMQIQIDSESPNLLIDSEILEADLCDKENDNYLKVNQGREQRKRRIIYSSSCEDEDNSPHYKIKGKKTKGLPQRRVRSKPPPASCKRANEVSVLQAGALDVDHPLGPHRHLNAART